MSFFLCIFDCDGVILDFKEQHKDCLNKAIEEIAGKEFVISEEDHLKTFDGKKSHEKLAILNSRGMPADYNELIWKKKQELTILALDDIEPDLNLISICRKLKEMGVKIACCSNSIRQTIEKALDKLGVWGYFDLIVSNEDCISPKGHPEIFWRAMIEFRALPEQTLVIEDSPVGLLAAYRSGAKVLRVKSPKDLNMKEIKESMSIEKGKSKWVDKKMNVLLPCSGRGSRFSDAGYSLPKPLVDVKGKPMIQVVLECLNIEANYIFVIQKEHREKFNIDYTLRILEPNCKIIEIDGITEGAAISALYAKDLINNENPLIICNSDQWIKFSSSDFLYLMQEQKLDGGVLTFENISPKWSFLKNDENGFVCEVAEKRPISDRATCGLYFWRRGADFVESAEEMIAANERVLNEFYIFPTYSKMIEKGKKIKEYPVEDMAGLGTPEDLENFLKR